MLGKCAGHQGLGPGRVTRYVGPDIQKLTPARTDSGRDLVIILNPTCLAKVLQNIDRESAPKVAGMQQLHGRVIGIDWQVGLQEQLCCQSGAKMVSFSANQQRGR